MPHPRRPLRVFRAGWPRPQPRPRRATLYTNVLTFTGQDSTTLIDNSETVHISSLALLKMLRHGRAGVPMEVMGLMLGEFVDDYTVRVVDVFAMPQSGTGVSVEAVDPVFQTKMMDMLKQTGRYVLSREVRAAIF
jgi:JAB1/Mov34/MPN/PAD-1 ubiquitin protease